MVGEVKLEIIMAFRFQTFFAENRNADDPAKMGK